MCTQIEMYYKICITCGITFGIPSEFNDQLQKNGKDFYCPSGHSQHYIIGKTLKEQLQEKNTYCIRLESTVKHQDHVINGYKGQVTKLRKAKV